MIQEVKIGKSDIITTKLGLGTNKVGGHNLFGGLKDEDGYALVKKALDSGIKFIDTAYMYGKGRSEEIIGDVIQNYDRSKLIIATKAAQDPNNNDEFNNTPVFLKQAVEDALKRLKTDYIDIFYIHFPDNKTPKDQAVEALDELKKAGKIRAIGVSNFTLAQIKAANVNNQVDVVEDHYSLVYREAEKVEWNYLRKHQISFVPYFPLASGLLTGKYAVSDYEKFSDHYSQDNFSAIVKALKDVEVIAEKHSATVAQTIIAWYMANPDISVVIPGARNASQTAVNAGALKLSLSTDEYQQIDHNFAQFKE